jgi:hypothetical protein
MSSRLAEVTVEYTRLLVRPKAMLSSYKAEVENIFHAVLENRSIHKLTVHSTGSSDGIYNLLANTTSLTKFWLHVRDMEEETAMSIASGFSKNSSLTKVVQESRCASPQETMLSGLAVSSSLESLIIAFSGASTASFFESVKKIIHFCAALEDLKIVARPTLGREQLLTQSYPIFITKHALA